MESSMLWLIDCPDPDCGVPAEVLDRRILKSTDGGIEHLKTYCVNKHLFVLPADWAASRERSRAPSPP
jgi:hypothetical protein